MVAQKICNLKFGEMSCSKVCTKSFDGRYLAKCGYHLNLASRKSKKARAKKNALAKDPIADEAVKREKSRLSMRTYRQKRKLDIITIENENVMRISALIDKIKSQQEYIIVPDAVSSLVMASEIKLRKRREPINFNQKKLPWTRFMQSVKNPEDILSDVLTALKIGFSKCVHLDVKLLTSFAGDPQQALHKDFDKEIKPVVRLSEFHYSAIVSLEKDTRLTVGPLKESINIPLHSMLLFRGDMLHAGAAYTDKNQRLFISASCDKFPVY